MASSYNWLLEVRARKAAAALFNLLQISYMASSYDMLTFMEWLPR